MKELIRMRKIWIFTTGAAVLFVLMLSAGAQDAPKPQEPEYINSFFLLDSSANLTPLEREPVGVAGKGRILVFGQAGISYEIQHDRSPVRIPAGAPLAIVVRLENHDLDPATLVVLYPLKIVKGKRQLLISGIGTLSIHTKSDLQDKQRQLTFAKFGQASLKITPASPLSPGEYAIAVQPHDGQPTAYCFGIDPTAN
jgi:hypothetical protein